MSLVGNAQPTGGPQRLVHYMPATEMADNKRVGGSLQADSITPADGTMYPTNATVQSGSGYINSEVSDKYGVATNRGFPVASELYTQNVGKVKALDPFFNRYKSIAGIRLSSLLVDDAKYTYASGTYQLAFNKLFDVSSSSFLMIRSLSGSTEALVVSMDTAGNLTPNTAVQITNVALTSGGTSMDLVQLSQTKYMAFYNNGTNFNARCFTISGTAITMGLEFTVVAAAQSAWSACYAGTDKVMLARYVGTTITYHVLTCTGTTTVTSASTGTVSSTGISPLVSVDAAGTSVLFLYKRSSDSIVMYRGATLSGTALSLGGTEIAAPTLSTSYNTDRNGCVIWSPQAGHFCTLTTSLGTLKNGLYFTLSGANATLQRVSDVYTVWSTANSSYPVLFTISSTNVHVYCYSSWTATEDQGFRMVDITTSPTAYTMSGGNYYTKPTDSVLGMSSYGNYGMAVGIFGTYQIAINIYSSVAGFFLYYVGIDATVEVNKQTYVASVLTYTNLITANTAKKGLVCYHYSIGKAMGGTRAWLQLKLTSATAAYISIKRLFMNVL